MAYLDFNTKIDSLSGYTNTALTGAASYISKFNATNSGITKSVIYDNTGFIGFNTITPQYQLDISGSQRISNQLNSTILFGSGSQTGYSEINVKNFNNFSGASSDLVATSDIGTDSNYYVNLGINSSTYSGLFVGLSGDGYLFSQANDFFIGNTAANRNVHFFAGNNPTGTNSGVFSISSGAMTVNRALFISGNPVVPFVSGSGIIFSNFNSNPTINTRLHEQSGLPVSGSIAISANTYSSIASGNYVAGGWLFLGNVTAISPGMNRLILNTRLWDNVSVGNTYYIGQAMSIVGSGGAGILGMVSLPFVQFVNLTGATNLVSLSATTNFNSSIIVIPSGNLVAGTPSGTMTYMRGIRLY